MLALALLATPSTAASRPRPRRGGALIDTRNRTDFSIKLETDAPWEKRGRGGENSRPVVFSFAPTSVDSNSFAVVYLGVSASARQSSA